MPRVTDSKCTDLNSGLPDFRAGALSLLHHLAVPRLFLKQITPSLDLVHFCWLSPCLEIPFFLFSTSWIPWLQAKILTLLQGAHLMPLIDSVTLEITFLVGKICGWSRAKILGTGGNEKHFQHSRKGKSKCHFYLFPSKLFFIWHLF